MKKSRATKLLKPVIGLAAGLVFAIMYLYFKNLGGQPLVEQYRILCDAFTLPGTFMIAIGLMILMGNLGALDALGFIFHFLWHTFIPATGPGMHYYDYIMERREHRLHGYGFLFVSGGILTAVGIVFLILFYQVL